MKSSGYASLKFRLFALLALVCLLGTSVAISPARAQQVEPVAPRQADGQLVPQVSEALVVEESAPLAGIQPLSASALNEPQKEPAGVNKPIPRPNRTTRTVSDNSTIFTEPLENPPSPTFPSTITPARSFDGLSAADDAATINATYAPPDTDGAVGPNHYIQMVNSIYAVYNKTTGALLGGPWANNALWSGKTGACATSNDGDPVVLYDQLADRWLISQFALPNYPVGPFYECIAVSTTANPLGTWSLYTFQISATKMDDYPKLGVWPDGYYMSVNQFIPSNPAASQWAGTGAVVFERSQMLTGGTARMVYFDNSTDDIGGLLPSNLQGSATPPAGAPNYFVQMSDDAWAYTASDLLRVWEFHVDWTTTANSTFTKVSDLPTAAFDTDLCAYSRDCIAQPGTTQKVDAISDRLMHLLQYRNFNSYQTMVVNQTVDLGNDHAGVRWYELRKTNSTWSIYQQGDYAPDADQRWMGSMSMDGQGNLALGYSVSSSNTYPSVRFTGRLNGDPLGSMTLGESSIVVGGGSQLGVSRWGDYSAMKIDPTDDCTFWYTQEYVKSSVGTYNWSTRIGAFKFPGCGATWGSLSGTVSSGGNPVQGALVTVAGGSSVTTAASGYYTFAGLPAGSYNMTVTKYGYLPGSASSVSVADGGAATQNFSLTAKPLSTVSGVVTNAATGAPLPAAIYIPEYPGSPINTNPVTGAYSVQLEDGTTHHFTAKSTGYLSGTALITPASAAITQNFALSVDIAACIAPGYVFISGFSQDFNGASFPPASWTVGDAAGTGVIWEFNTTWGDDNFTGGTGTSAAVNSDTAGTEEFDTTLNSPAITIAGLPGQYLTYKANYKNYDGFDFLDLDVKVDGGSWTNVLRWNEDHGAGHSAPGENVAVNLASSLSGHTNFQFRWRYYDPNTGDWDWYTQVDDVRLGICLLDSTAPVVTAFTVTTPVASLNLPITAFTATDANGVTGYLVTTSATPPASDAAGWSSTVPATYTVAGPGTYTLYPWAKDGAGNVSAVFGSPRTVVVIWPVSDVLIMSEGAWNKYAFSTGNYLGGVWTGTGASCTPALIDYDGDGTKEYSQLCGGAWHFYNQDGSYNKGIWVGDFAGSIPVPGDYNGDGIDEPVLFSAGAWHFFDFATATYDAAASKWTGTGPGCVPAPLDYNGDGKMKFSLFCGGPWHFYNSDGSYAKGIWIGGSASDIPAPGDYDGNLAEEVVAFSGGVWHFFDYPTAAYNAAKSIFTGLPVVTAKPAPIDYDQDGMLNFALYANGTWYFYNPNGSVNKNLATGSPSTAFPMSRRLLP